MRDSITTSPSEPRIVSYQRAVADTAGSVRTDNAAYQPRRARRAVGCMRLFGDGFGSMRRFISPSEMVRHAEKSARERAMSSRNSGC